MKSCYLLALPKRMQAAVLAIGTLLLASCAIGYDGSGTFSSGVSDSQLASPSADDITFTPNVSGTEVTITWPVVMGAGGYEVSFYNMNDPDNPVAVGDENEVIDGCSTTRAIAEDTQYEFRIRALENTEYGNIGAESPTIAEYDTYVPSVGTIPSGTDLATYFADFSSTEVSPTEVAYELEAGGNYTMTGNVDFDRHWLTLRGDRNDPPTVTIIGDAKFTTTAGLKIKFIHFDCNQSTADAFLAMSSTPDPALTNGSNYYLTNPVAIQSCDIRGLQGYLVGDGSRSYYLSSLTISDCRVELNTQSSNRVFRFDSGFIITFTIENSTMWELGNSRQYFVRYSGGRPTNINASLRSTIAYRNNTFYNVCYSGQWGNYNGLGNRDYCIWTLTDNIFVDCGSEQVVRRMFNGQRSDMNNATVTINHNTYWYDGELAESEVGENNYDRSGTHLLTDPSFVNAPSDFTPQGADQLQYRTGDPHWLPGE